MDQEQNQRQSGPQLCRNGCGFYGSSSFDGLCSKCHKDTAKEDKDSVPQGTSSAADDLSQRLQETSALLAASAQPTVPVRPATPEKSDKSEEASPPKSASASAASCEVISEALSPAPSPADGSAKKKKNRCEVCRKKVGLTGFTCRCERLFCSLHRYSDKHDCSFDYRCHGQQEIRKNNPVIIGEKVNKI